MTIKAELNKEEIVKKEERRLKRIYKELDEKRKKATEGLIQEAAYMRATLGELKALIDRDGPIDDMPQGDYSILREHPAVKTYNTMIQRYSSVTKQLNDLLPKEPPKDDDDGFEKFVNERD